MTIEVAKIWHAILLGVAAAVEITVSRIERVKFLLYVDIREAQSYPSSEMIVSSEQGRS